MAGLGDERFFWGALGLSLVAHLGVAVLQSESAQNGPDLALEEQLAKPPMTVRIYEPAPVSPPRAIDQLQPVLASEAGTRTVSSPSPPEFERQQPDPELELPEPIEPPSLEPPPEPEIPEQPEPEKLEPLERVEPEPADPVQPIQSDGQAAVKGRAVPDAKRNRPPSYPRRARAARMEGTCELLVEVRKDGSVESAVVTVSSGHDLLDDSALKAVKKWRFKPATGTEGSAVPDQVTVPVTFRLKGR